jgi:hypothetical protein
VVEGLVPDVSQVQSMVIPILVVGATIVGAFLLFRLGKRAANKL